VCDGGDGHDSGLGLDSVQNAVTSGPSHRPFDVSFSAELPPIRDVVLGEDVRRLPNQFPRRQIRQRSPKQGDDGLADWSFQATKETTP